MKIFAWSKEKSLFGEVSEFWFLKSLAAEMNKVYFFSLYFRRLKISYKQKIHDCVQNCQMFSNVCILKSIDLAKNVNKKEYII